MNFDLLLTQLENAQLLRRLGQADAAYIFKHALTQEAAYNSLLKGKRAGLHRHVAQAIEGLCLDQAEQNAPVLALHYERAGMDDKAFTYAALAGDVAHRAFAHAEALSSYDRALAIAGRLADLPLARVRQVYTHRGNVFEVMGNHVAAIENYRAMIAFAQQHQDLAMEADGLNCFLTAQGVIGHVTDAEQQLNLALELARRSGEPALIVRALWNAGLAVRFQDPPRAADYFRQAFDLARAQNLRELAAFALSDWNIELQFTGQWRMLLEHGRQALEEFRALDNKPMIANALGMLAVAHYGRGEEALARAAAEEGVRISQAIENPWGVGYNEWQLLSIEIDAGEFDTARARGERILETIRPLRVPFITGSSQVRLARLYLELNQLDLAQRYAEEGTRAFDAMHLFWSAMTAGIQGLVFLRRGILDRAHETLDPVWREGDDLAANSLGFSWAGPALAELTLAEGRLDFGLRFSDWLLGRYEVEEMWGVAAEMYYCRGKIHLAREGMQLAETDLMRAREIAERSKNRSLSWRVDAALATLYTRRGDAGGARAARQRAGAMLHTLATNISDAALRESFLQRRDVAEVLRSGKGEI